MAHARTRRGAARRFDIRAWSVLLLWLAMAVLGGWVALLEIGPQAQFLMASTLVLAMAVLKLAKPSGVLRIAFLLAGLFITTRYMLWRTLYTLPPVDSAGFVPGILLYGAEMYAYLVMALGMFVNIHPFQRRILPPEGERTAWPTVDVFIPTYDEAPEIVEATVIAAVRIAYPADRMAVYVLDDGGTAQKLADPDPLRRAAAAARAERLKAVCEREGAVYLTREHNLHAKAGNLNAALPRSNGELILVLDADHVPTNDFLLCTVGPFQRDPLLFLVQTPHFFVSPDPLERNLQTFGHMPGEPEMFYRVIQHGLDFWNASFFCGSAAVLRRRCLEEAGGFSGASITEDAETALALHARGYNSAYIDRPMVAGLSPETFGAFIGQRTRWAQGMTQIMLLDRPLFKRGLTLPQRLAYTGCAVFWFFSFARLVFFLAPPVYLYLGLAIYETDAWGFVAYVVPHMIATMIVSNLLYGAVRWPFVSELYETIQSPHIMAAILKVLAAPRKPAFVVTPKGETVTSRHISPLAGPFVAMWALLAGAFVAGALRFALVPEQQAAVLVVGFWNLLNLLVVGAALGVVLEHIQLRQWPRMPVRRPARLRLGGAEVAATIVDLSMGGAQLRVPPSPAATLPALPATGTVGLDLDSRRSVELPVVILARDTGIADGEADVRLHCRFAVRTAQEREEVVELFYGSSTQWTRFLGSHRKAPGVLVGTALFVGTSLRYTALTLGFLLRGGRSRARPAESPAAGDEVQAEPATAD